MSFSLDGFVAGPDQSLDDPVGAGGLRLHEWHWHADEPGHQASVKPRDWLMARRDAVIMGRKMFGPVRGEWDENWRGWWGEEPPYHAPVYVLTHFAREPITMKGGFSTVWTTPVSRRSRPSTHRTQRTSATAPAADSRRALVLG
jgi:dihydrofolate reductase